MNYSNMIEEKNLKKTFIIATLCSTLVGTFSSSIGLWDRVQDRRKQMKRDTKQDDDVKQLRERVEKAEKRVDERERRSDRRDDRGEDVGGNFQQSGALIQRQFDEGFGRLGNRFAVGDTLTENQLQKQIIALQQTVITVLQDALYNDRQLTRGDMAKLVAASDAAREGSIDALRDQQRRLAIEETPLTQRSLLPPKRASTIIQDDPLFCRYSLDLQYIAKKPLAAAFALSGDCQCPDCGRCLDVSADDFWKIGKRTPVIIADGPYEKEIMETREFHLGQRFVVKCHTPDGEYACVLCNKHRERDALCRTVEALVNHVGKFHDITELERDLDLKETVPLAALPPPLAPMAPMREVREMEVRQYR